MRSILDYSVVIVEPEYGPEPTLRNMVYMYYHRNMPSNLENREEEANKLSRQFCEAIEGYETTRNRE